MSDSMKILILYNQKMLISEKQGKFNAQKNQSLQSNTSKGSKKQKHIAISLDTKAIFEKNSCW